MDKKIVLSIKPFFSDEIYKGNKLVELRRNVGLEFKENSEIYIYSTSPQKCISGSAKIMRIDKVTVKHLLDRHLGEASIDATNCISYFKGKEYAYLIWLKDVKQFESPLNLSQLRELNFTPPQSFIYATKEIIHLVESKCQ